MTTDELERVKRVVQSAQRKHLCRWDHDDAMSCVSFCADCRESVEISAVLGVLSRAALAPTPPSKKCGSYIEHRESGCKNPDCGKTAPTPLTPAPEKETP